MSKEGKRTMQKENNGYGDARMEGKIIFIAIIVIIIITFLINIGVDFPMVSNC